MVGAARQAGLTIVRTSRIGKRATQSETLAEAGALKAAGAQAVMLLAAPLVFLNLATSAQSQAYRPVWMGPGMTNGLNPVAEVGCPAIAGARFLSPFSQIDVIDRFDPDLRAAARRYNGAEPTDITLVAWGLNKTFHRMVEAAGSDLYRQGFLAALRSGREFASNVFPRSATRPAGPSVPPRPTCWRPTALTGGSRPRPPSCRRCDRRLWPDSASGASAGQRDCGTGDRH